MPGFLLRAEAGAYDWHTAISPDMMKSGRAREQAGRDQRVAIISIRPAGRLSQSRARALSAQTSRSSGRQGLGMKATPFAKSDTRSPAMPEVTITATSGRSA